MQLLSPSFFLLVSTCNYEINYHLKTKNINFDVSVFTITPKSKSYLLGDLGFIGNDLHLYTYIYKFHHIWNNCLNPNHSNFGSTEDGDNLRPNNLSFSSFIFCGNSSNPAWTSPIMGVWLTIALCVGLEIPIIQLVAITGRLKWRKNIIYMYIMPILWAAYNYNEVHNFDGLDWHTWMAVCT